MPGKMGYRTRDWAGGDVTLELGVPGTYRVFAWIERDGLTVSVTQNCVFEILPNSSVVLGGG